MDQVEFLHFLGILLSKAVDGPIHLYWTNGNGQFPSMNYGKVMSRNRFEDIMRYLQLSNDSDKELQGIITIRNYSENSFMLSTQNLEMLYIPGHTSVWMSL